ncbi:dienelactone hydrolase family protein, partial [Salmonella enterica]|uniref:dienelactone hydrolase family protein n=1 Tax=Salmonella enterica TaxID=28901 RepID=UPI0020CF8F2D
YAAHNPQLKAAVAWYGKLVGDTSLNSPKHPVDIATDLNAPVLCVHSETCGHAFALESNGDLYNCDHFVYPEHLLGNIHQHS